jgi:16S rRNA (guanine966-N2)-methyltransferase
MKDNIREALFNLVGGWVKNKAVFDVFAGTGAMGLEALSRGASQATFVERHFPSAQLIRKNVENIDPELRVKVEASDSFFWARQFKDSPSDWPKEPWVVFLCPPYAFFADRGGEMLDMISFFYDSSPPESVLVVESDHSFDTELLPDSKAWRVRDYAPARVSVIRPSLDNRYDC